MVEVVPDSSRWSGTPRAHPPTVTRSGGNGNPRSRTVATPRVPYCVQVQVYSFPVYLKERRFHSPVRCSRVGVCAVPAYRRRAARRGRVASSLALGDHQHHAARGTRVAISRTRSTFEFDRSTSTAVTLVPSPYDAYSFNRRRVYISAHRRGLVPRPSLARAGRRYCKSAHFGLRTAHPHTLD